MSSLYGRAIPGKTKLQVSVIITQEVLAVVSIVTQFALAHI